MWNRRWLFWTEVFFWVSSENEKEEEEEEEKKKTKWWCKVIIVINNRHVDILKKYLTKLTFHPLSIYPFGRISISPNVTIITQCENAPVSGVARLLVLHFKRKRTLRSWHHVGETRESWAMFYILYHSAEIKGRISKLNVVSKTLEGLLALCNVTVGPIAAVYLQEGHRKKW